MRRTKHSQPESNADTGVVDQFLVERCLAGDDRAWATLIERYKRLVYHFPVQAKLEPDDCDEVFQETFLALYKQLANLTRLDDLSFWLSRVAQRITWRTVKAKSTLMEGHLEAFESQSESDIQEKELIRQVQEFKIRNAILQMNHTCRVLLVRLFYESDDTDYQGLADQLGIAMGSVGPTRSRCLVKLKKILARMGIDEKNVSSWLK
ncbi:MAG: sigma-70 family RNA polymerase sigma factor [Acidobacteria bacterium]|nr:sigma-70 family RNA polymerase sigma factor [Acidobacteriota bacterium]